MATLRKFLGKNAGAKTMCANLSEGAKSERVHTHTEEAKTMPAESVVTPMREYVRHTSTRELDISGPSSFNAVHQRLGAPEVREKFKSEPNAVASAWEAQTHSLARPRSAMFAAPNDCPRTNLIISRGKP